MILLPAAVSSCVLLRDALTQSEAEVAQVMSGLRPDASPEVQKCTAAVIETLASHYFYSITEEWPVHALAKMAANREDSTSAQQGLATLGALAGSLRKGKLWFLSSML